MLLSNLKHGSNMNEIYVDFDYEYVDAWDGENLFEFHYNKINNRCWRFVSN